MIPTIYIGHIHVELLVDTYGIGTLIDLGSSSLALNTYLWDREKIDSESELVKEIDGIVSGKYPLASKVKGTPIIG